MIILFTLHLLAWAALVLALYGAYQDVRHLRIDNIVCISVAALAVAVLGFQQTALAFGLIETVVLGGWLSHLISGAVVFAIGYGLFASGLWGGGDAKLAAALALWLPVQALPIFLITMSLTGAVLALVTLAVKHKPQLVKPLKNKFTVSDGWMVALSKGENALPYGVAITLGAAHAFLVMGYLS